VQKSTGVRWRVDAFLYICRRWVEAYCLQAVLLGFGVAACIAAGIWMVSNAASLRLATDDLNRLRAARPMVDVTATRVAAPVLPSFASSRLVGQIHAAAAQLGVAIDEINLTFENSLNQPFLRYRANFKVTTRYPSIRSFAAITLASSKELELDGVSCSRADLNTPDVTCDFTVSALYERDSHG